MNVKRNNMKIFLYIIVCLHVLKMNSEYCRPIIHHIFLECQKKYSKLDSYKDMHLERYLSAHKYITTNDSVAKQIIKTFKTVQKIKKRAKIAYCIDSVAQPLTISGFDAIKDADLRSKIRLIEIGKIPIELMEFSICTDEKTTFNLIFSILNESFMTAEISTRFLNPLGGSSKGPSIKYLFYFDQNNIVEKVFFQKYLNG